MFVYVGTFTGETGAEGISVYRMDGASGALAHVQTVPGLLSPSFLALHPRRPVLYAVERQWTPERRDVGAVSAFAVDPATGALRPLDRRPSGGASPCYVSVHPGGRHVLANVAPAVLARLLGDPVGEPAPEGAQLKLNMLLARLPRLRDPAVDPREAFAGTFHVNETASALAAAHATASAGRLPEPVPCEIYCHSLTDPSILGPELRAAGAQTLTCFALQLPVRLFSTNPASAKEAAVAATLRSLNTVLAEPIEDCVWRTPEGEPCLEARTPLELEAELGLPGGNIFHRELAWPHAEYGDAPGCWGVETRHANVLLCGAGARRGGGVSGIPGHNAAMAVLRGR